MQLHPTLTRELACKLCGSYEQRLFSAEIAIHSRESPKNPAKPLVWVFPKLRICLDCGHAEFSVPEAELGALSAIRRVEGSKFSL